MLQRIKSKKGFTLAELLIVVAIIAVLTAIAVPLFVSAVDKAEKATEDANMRAVRSTAIVKILEDKYSTTSNYWGTDFKTGGTDPKTFEWYVTAVISENGEFKNLTIEKKPTSFTPGYDKATRTVRLVLTETEVA